MPDPNTDKCRRRIAEHAREQGRKNLRQKTTATDAIAYRKA